MEFLFDTNALVRVSRATEVGARLLKEIGIRDNDPIIASSISRGEIEFFAKSSKWSSETLAAMRALLERSLIVGTERPGVALAYAEIQYQTRHVTTPARPGSDNDVWIAASARATGTCLVTSDTWFRSVGGSLLDLAFYNASTGVVSWQKAAS